MENLNEVNASQEQVVGVQEKEVVKETLTTESSQTVESEKKSEVAEPSKEQTAEENANFKKMRLRTEELEKKLKEFEEASKLYGYEKEEDFAQVLKSNFERQQIESLMGNGMSEEEAKVQLEKEKELENLRRFKTEYEKEQARKQQNLEFLEYYKDIHGRYPTDSDPVPKEVFEISERTGTPLKYAYADYLAKNALKKEQIEKVNKENAESSAPSMASQGVKKEYYTAEEVKNMSRDDVKKNWKVITESMKKWKK